MSTNMAPAGWYPDPGDPAAGLRWWDGMQWTSHAQPPLAPSPSGPGLAFGSSGTMGAPPSFASRNSQSLTAAAVAVVYVVVALTSRIVFFGIFPILLSVRAVSRKEQLAPVAVIAAVISVLVAVVALVHV